VIIKQQSELSDSEVDGFILFAESNKRVLNTMVRNNPSLMNGSFSLLVQNPKVLEFDNKRTYFTQQLHKGGRKNHPQVQINVRRQYVFEESYQQLQGRSGDAIKYGKLNVTFRDEEGVDAGGVTREWFSALALQMFNPDYALFRPSAADRVTYQPNRASGINPDHLFYFKFVGRIIGKAIYDGRLLDAHFTRSFYKCMISAPVDHKDMEAIDPEFYKSLDWILHNNITDVLDLNFSMEVDDFGRRKVIDLLPNGRNLPVTESNKIEYVRLVTEQKLVIAIQDQIQAFLSGFHEIIPKDLIKIFNEQELELLISGLPDIDIDDWKSNTEYQNYTASSPQIQWFWRAVRSFSQEERAKLIQFATGTSKVPLGGFAQLQGSTGIQKFQIHKEFSSTARLPSAHTW
jgi:E3 ubiquitin-protein ligase HUWE1